MEVVKVGPEVVAAIVSAAWPVFAAFCGCLFIGLVWCIRLESEVRYLRRDHDDHKKHQEERGDTLWAKIDVIQTSMNSLIQAIGRVEGRLGGKD